MDWTPPIEEGTTREVMIATFDAYRVVVWYDPVESDPGFVYQIYEKGQVIDTWPLNAQTYGEAIAEVEHRIAEVWSTI